MLILMTVLISLFALFVVMFLVEYRAYDHSRLIRVIYENNTFGMIKRTRLEKFIFSGSITKFFRSSGWVTIGADPTRKTNHGHLRERREIATC